MQQPRASPLPPSLRAAPASTQRAAFVKPLRPWGRQPGNGKLHSGIQVPRAASCPRRLTLVLLLLLLEGVKRGRRRPGQAVTALIARSGGQALGEGGRAELCLHASLTEPAFCKILCRAAAPWTLLPSTLVLGLRNHPLPGPRPGPSPLGLTSAAGGSVWPISGGLARARTEAVASSGDPLWLLQGTCSPHGGAGPGPLRTAPLISSLVSPALSALNGVISPSAGTTFSEPMPVRS